MIWFFPSSEFDFSILSSRFYDLRSFFWKRFSNFVHMSFEVLLLVFYYLISGEGWLIAWAGLDWLLPAVRVCLMIEDESICLCCTEPLWGGSWMFELISLHCLFFWLLGGTKWYLKFMEFIVIFKSVYVSLSTKLKPGLIPQIFKSSVNYVNALIISLSLLFFIAVVRMVLQTYK